MKILAISDVVSKKLYGPYISEIAGDVDLIISCGDLPAYYLNYIVTSLCKPLLYVCGNHDHYIKQTGSMNSLSGLEKFYFDELEYLNSSSNFGGKNMDNRIEIFNKVIFSGLEGSVLYNRGEHQYTDNQMRMKIARLAPKLMLNKLTNGRFIDILITHAPPRGIHDKEDLPHHGFKPFLGFMEKYRPKYLIHGHIHIYDNNEVRVTRYLDTTVINCYEYQKLDIEIP